MLVPSAAYHRRMGSVQGTRSRGRLTTWNDERGFGFLRPGDGGSDVFVHISGFPRDASRPEVGVGYRWDEARMDDGRIKAINVRPDSIITVGRPGGQRVPLRLGTLSYLAIAAFIPVFIAGLVHGHVPWWLSAIYAAVSVGTLTAYALDKSAARAHRWRIAERSLLLLGLIGGWPGAIVAQQLFRHKTRKRRFLLAFWGSVVLNVAAFSLLAFWLLPAASSLGG